MILSPGVSWSFHEGNLRVHGDHLLVVEHCPPDVPECLRLIERGEPLPDVSTGRSRQTRKVLELLREAGAIVPRPRRDWAGTPVERQIGYFAALRTDADIAQARLARARVTIVGVGGIGGVVLCHLAGAGVRHFTLIDHDEVHADNFNRQQMFLWSDIGRAKVDAAADWVRQRVPAATICAVEARVATSGDLVPYLKDATAAVLAADEPPGEIQLTGARACQRTGTAFITASCGLRTAAYGPLVTAGEVAHYVTELESALRQDEPAPSLMTASFGPTNTIAGAYAAHVLIRWLAGLPGDCPAPVTVSFP